MDIKVKLDKDAYMPEKAHREDAGFDIRTPKDFYLYAFDEAVIDTGVHVAIPEGYVGMLKSKSGLNVRYGITCEGVIDSGYTGSIVAKLYRRDERPGAAMEGFEKGNKITQLVILPIPDVDLVEVDCLDETERGDGGFGSTGK